MTVSIIIPTLNALRFCAPFFQVLEQQTCQNYELIILDSESDDGSKEIYIKANTRIETIVRSTFKHADVRNNGADIANGDILVFMTQDAIPNHSKWLENLIKPLVEGVAAASFARQIPYPNANPLEQFARATNYPDVSRVVSKADIPSLGIRAAFFSNSCSAIRKDVFDTLGGFPTHTIMNEDMMFAINLLKNDYNIAYTVEAIVNHSHNYSLSKTFQRYFDIGVVFKQAEQDLEGFATRQQGLDYVQKLFRHLIQQRKFFWLPIALAESCVKWLGINLGKRYNILPSPFVTSCSMHKSYWKQAS